MDFEKTLRKCENVCGTWVRLGNGELWCVPAMPLGKKRIKILDLFKQVIDLQEKTEKATPTEQFAMIEAGLDVSAKLAYEMLLLNYPLLTPAQFDSEDLVTMQHGRLFLDVLQGRNALGEIIDLKKSPAQEMTSTLAKPIPLKS